MKTELNRAGRCTFQPRCGERNKTRLSRHVVFAAIMAGAITMGPMVQLVRADEALYDNLDVEGGVVMNGSHIIGPFFQPRDRFAAQPFFTSEHEAISSVTVKLQRRGNPTGPLEFEIWNDRNGKPNDLVASFGTIDLATISADEADHITLNRLVTGLDTNSLYHVVLDPDNAEIPNDRNSYHIGITNQKNGTNDAPRLQVSIGRNHDRWIELGNPLPGSDYLQMAVNAVPLVGDFNQNAILDADDINILSAQVRLNPNDATMDLNNDGILTAADRTRWVRDHATSYFGDSNLDGEFNSSDLTAIFKANTFELDVDAGWAEGDWNGDGRFDTSDLTAAFKEGGYETGPRAAVATVPEPAGWLLFAIGVIGMLRRKKA